MGDVISMPEACGRGKMQGRRPSGRGGEMRSDVTRKMRGYKGEGHKHGADSQAGNGRASWTRHPMLLSQ